MSAQIHNDYSQSTSTGLVCIHLPFAICPFEYNKETICLIKTDPCFQIIIATVAFSNGLNAKTLLDSQIPATCLDSGDDRMREFDADGRKRVIYAQCWGFRHWFVFFLKDRRVWTLISIGINVICVYIENTIDFEEGEYVERL